MIIVKETWLKKHENQMEYNSNYQLCIFYNIKLLIIIHVYSVISCGSNMFFGFKKYVNKLPFDFCTHFLSQ